MTSFFNVSIHLISRYYKFLKQRFFPLLLVTQFFELIIIACIQQKLEFQKCCPDLGKIRLYRIEKKKNNKKTPLVHYF